MTERLTLDLTVKNSSIAKDKIQIMLSKKATILKLKKIVVLRFIPAIMTTFSLKINVND